MIKRYLSYGLMGKPSQLRPHSGLKGFFKGVCVTITVLSSTGYLLLRKGEPSPVNTQDINLRVALKPREKQDKSCRGSGVIWDKQGHIVTCAHVTCGAPSMIVIHGVKECLANVIAEDSEEDVALLRPVSEPISCERPFSERAIYRAPACIHVSAKQFVVLGNDQLSALPVIDNARSTLVTPRRVFNIGRLNSRPGFSGGGILIDNGETLGIYRIGAYFGESFQWFGGYIRSAHLHTVVNRMLMMESVKKPLSTSE